MGYFAVLRPESTSRQSSENASVRRCHINVWSLSSLIPGRRLFYFDVGLEVVAGDEPIDHVELLLPFRVEEGPWKGHASNDKTAQDLYDAISVRASAELVFGGPVQIDDYDGAHRLRIGDYPDPLHLGRLKPSHIRPADAADQREDSSHYAVPLLTPIPAKQTRYIRMRWRIFGARPLWSWKRSRGGAIFDFRVCDVRESPFAESETPLRQRMIPIREINIFLIAPAKYQAATTSPQWKYLRTLEAGAWRRYLTGTAYMWLRGAMVVYYWRRKPDGVTARHVAVDAGVSDPDGVVPPASVAQGWISPDNPFRVFADFNIPGARSWWQELCRLAAALALLAIIVRLTTGNLDISHLPWATMLGVLGGASLLGIIGLVQRAQNAMTHRFLAPRLWLRKVERAAIGKH